MNGTGEATYVEIDLHGTVRSGPLPGETDDVEEDDDGQGEPRHEETLGDLASGHLLVTDGPNGNVELGIREAAGSVSLECKGYSRSSTAHLGDEDEAEEDETEPRTVDTSGGGEGKLLDRVSLSFPGGSESDVAHANRHPGEDGRETREGQEPVKDRATGARDVDVGDGSEDQDGNDRGEGTTRLVDVGEDLGSVSSLGQGGQGSGSYKRRP